MEKFRSFGFAAEYPGGGPVFDEFEQYLRIEFAQRHPGSEPRFGKASWFDPLTKAWNFLFLLTGNVPEATTAEDARRKAGQLVRRLDSGFKLAHANPGNLLPRPLIRVWEWEG